MLKSEVKTNVRLCRCINFDENMLLVVNVKNLAAKNNAVP
jgi:hypothetical protein